MSRVAKATALACLLAGWLGVLAGARAADTHAAEMPGVTASEITLGSIAPYSGPASVYSVYGHVFEGYFARVNERGGINGRKVRVLSYDDAYSPPKTVEQARRLVESDEVVALFGVVGTPTNAAIEKYMNGKHVPQLFAATGSSLFADPAQFPWTIGFQPNYQAEGRMYATWLRANKPDAKIAVLYQDDDFGKDLLKGLTEGLGDAKSSIVAAASYDTRVPSVDSQIVQLKASGADTLLDFTTPKFSTQAIRKVAEMQWRPTQILASVGSHVGSVLKPAGLENAVGVMTGRWVKDPSDPGLADDAGVRAWKEFMARYYPSGDLSNSISVIAYVLAQTMEAVLVRCGDNLSRDNIMRQATTVHDVASELLMPGVRIEAKPSDYLVVRDLQMARFDGAAYRSLGPVTPMTR